MQKNTPSLKKRYFYKLIRNTTGSVLSIFTLPLITRSLGPEYYGIINYLKVYYTNIIAFFDIGTLAFYPKLSRQPGNTSILYFVALYDFILIVLSFIALGLVFVFGKGEDILSTKSFIIAGLILLWVWLLIIQNKTISLMDALGGTIISEVVFLVFRITITVGLLLLFFIESLNHITYLNFQNITLLLFLIIILVFIYNYFSGDGKPISLKLTANEFIKYSQPLFISETLVLFAVLVDRWLLQIFNGSIAQGYFSLGLTIGVICVTPTAVFAPLLLREYAIAFEENNKTKLQNLFSKHLFLFFTLTASLACFLAIHGDWVTYLAGGEDFNDAAIPVMLLAIVHLYYTYGHFSGSLMLATDRTLEFAKINVFITILGLPTTYFMLAPQQYWGLNLGPVGLAIKMLILTILVENIRLRINTRYLGLKLSRFLIHQVSILTIFLIVGFILKSLVSSMFGIGVFSLLISGISYLLFTCSLIFFYPNLIAMTRSELLGHIKTPSSFFKI